MDNKELNEKLDKIEQSLDRIAVSLEKLSKCIDEQEHTFCTKGIEYISQDY